MRLAVRTALFLALTTTLAPPGSARAQPSPATRPAADAGSAADLVRRLVDRGADGLGLRVADAIRQGESADAPQPAKAAAAWLSANREAFDGTRAVGVVPQGGRATFRPGSAAAPGKVYLVVFDWHASGKVIVYDLSAANVKRAYRPAEPGKALKVESTPRDTVVEVAAKNAKAPDPVATVVVLELDGEPRVTDRAVAQAADGSVLMHARDAVVTGRNLRYEPEPNKDTLGYWTLPADGAHWLFKLDRGGAFDVEALVGCKGGGSTVEFLVDDAAFPMVVQDTGHFQNFVPRVVGRATVAGGGPHRLAVRVKAKQGGAVMDLRQVTLKPVKE